MKGLSKILVAVLAVTVLLMGGAGVALALSGTYIYTDGGSYYTRYGPSQYWHTVSNAGYCGHIWTGCTGPNQMEWTYRSCPSPVNYAKWDNIDSAQWATEDIFIPSVHATTTAAPYVLTYNGASSYPFTINQNVYYDQWVSSDPERSQLVGYPEHMA